MGILALVDFALIRELCDKVKRDNKSFTGRVKHELEDDESTATNEKVGSIQRLLLSGKRKSKDLARQDKKKRKSKHAVKTPARFRQESLTESDSNSDSDSGESNSSANDLTEEEEVDESGGSTVPTANIK